MASPGQGYTAGAFNVFSELVSTTFRTHKKEIADNVSKHNALYRRITTSGQVKEINDGGISYALPLEYASNSTYTRYSGYDALNINAVDVISAAEFPFRSVAVTLAASGQEIRANAGVARTIDLVKSKVKNAQHSMANGLSTDMYSDGTALNQINGLQALVADAGTGTVGGIISGSYPFWQNTVQSAAAPLQGGSAITVSATTIESLMAPLYIKLTRGIDKPDLIVMSDDYFILYEQSQTSLKRYAPSDNGQGGMISMKYKEADVFFDSAGGIPSAHAYFLNSRYLHLFVRSQANMTISEDVRSINQDAVVKMIIWEGNLGVSNRSLQGVMKA